MRLESGPRGSGSQPFPRFLGLGVRYWEIDTSYRSIVFGLHIVFLISKPDFDSLSVVSKGGKKALTPSVRAFFFIQFRDKTTHHAIPTLLSIPLTGLSAYVMVRALEEESCFLVSRKLD